MSVREVRRGAGLAGAILVAITAIEALVGPRGIGAEHFTTAIFGLWLIGVAAAGRR
jgi:hypothetical protein